MLLRLVSPNQQIFLIPEILKTLEEIKAQVNTLGQGMNRIEIEHSDRSRNEDRQPNQRREDRINRNYDRFVDDGRYLKNIKLEVSNFDGRLDP